MDRHQILAPLGPNRLRLLECLGGNDVRLPGYFAAAEGLDVLQSFRQHVASLVERWSKDADPLTASLLAAARLLTGDLSACEAILDRLPVNPIKIDHGAGICVALPFQALSAALPLPKALSDTRKWLAGSADEQSLRTWLTDHRSELEWVESDGAYRLSGAARGLSPL